MKRALLFVLLAATVAIPAHLFARAPRTIEIEANDQMKFSVTSLTAKPGEELHVVLKNVGKMPKIAMAHNFVVLKSGTDATKFANDAVSAGPAANYIPAADKASVIASTALAGPGETVEVTFKAPAAGTYTFLCSFPGHFASGMKGTLTVK